ncbi:MAG: hypothetical protein KAJ16_02770 [Calditrichia bacterium]|nr:hypothetical protein [Calditrichia bacterium]
MHILCSSSNYVIALWTSYRHLSYSSSAAEINFFHPPSITRRYLFSIAIINRSLFVNTLTAVYHMLSGFAIFE